MDINNKEFLWVEKYRPKKIDDCILPERIKKDFGEFAQSGQIPNFLLTGTAGTGKTTIAKALCDEIGADILEINGSLEGRIIETLRVKIAQFTSTVSFGDGIKVVLVDEADHLNADSVQPALRAFMEGCSTNCRFIFTCNTPSRIIAPLHSRFTTVDFKIRPEEAPELQFLFMKRIIKILKNEGVEYSKDVIAELIKKYYPDFRKTLIELQRYSISGKIDEGIFINLSEDNYKILYSALKEKRFTDMRNWVGQNVSGNGLDIIDEFYKNGSRYLVPSSIPQMMMILAQYGYWAAFVSNHELNITSCLTEIMGQCEFK